MDPEFEKLELIRKLAATLGIEPDALQQISGGLEVAFGQTHVAGASLAHP
jgi:hypothetical protein